MKNNPFVKMMMVALLGIIGLSLLQSLVFGSGFGLGFTMRGNYGGEHMYMGTGYGFGYGGSISYLLLLMIKVLFVVFVIGLVAGIIVWIKNNLFTTEDVETIKNTFSGNKAIVSKESCTICGKELNAEWKVCPHCGKEKEIKNV
ncbi:hypothetical protein HNQ80_001079 [Anaerosolibacter carboniphilus]|uniref:Zinc-ribbon domain-containing protein n=1 Tax=Anaerosolibacter carboniphilus TaxID=1417629 RepID=A0A841KSH0_9FIRM|nr:zinc ribbon domain-containing protein [Anaerosolibacter carboniphilus]MBB6214990.1 hypothetical protein [Anaerosolibacter carboniphilus]